MALDKILKRLREAKGWTQTELAQRCGLDQAVISRLENGQIPHPRIQTVQALAATLGTTLDVLMGRLIPRRGHAGPDFVLRSRYPLPVDRIRSEIKKRLRDAGVTDSVLVIVDRFQDGEEHVVTADVTPLHVRRGRPPQDPRISRQLAERALAAALASPLAGCDRLAYELKWHGVHIGSSMIQRVLAQHGLATQEDRARFLNLIADQGGGLSQRQQEAVTKMKDRLNQTERSDEIPSGTSDPSKQLQR